MNVMQTKNHIDRLYRDVYKIIKTEFEAILNPIYQDIYDEAIDMGFDGDIRDLDEAWVEEFFDEYNPVTKYVFSNEIDRKKSRLFESLVASTKEKHQSYKTAENLLTYARWPESCTLQKARRYTSQNLWSNGRNYSR